MMPDLSPERAIHARAVAAELAWLETIISARLVYFFEDPAADFALPPPPKQDPTSAMGRLIAQADLTPQARCVLALALAPHVNSAILDPFFVKNSAIDRPFSQFGSQSGTHAAFRPTTETALFMIAGIDTAARIAAMALFEPDHPIAALAGVTVSSSQGEQNGSRLELAIHRVLGLCDGTAPRPDYSPSFPAKRLTTGLDWDDLVLPASVKDQLEHVLAWLQNRDTILNDWGLARHFGRGYKALFSGPPGTGKTLTATLLGQRTGLDVYRVDLSMVVSKYIGETEKNLGMIFDMAAQRDWILFFDEADALFGARTSASSSNDRHANQEVSYLLQRIEECQSLVILATNLRSNIDDAFFRRFQSTVAFNRPDFGERMQLWRNILADLPVDSDLDLKTLAREHDLSGASITNAVRHAAITARRRAASALSRADITSAISAELHKEGRTS
jgi:hypothetical protein